MNITSCPRCGGRVRSVSIGWKCESCQGFIDMRGEFHQHKEEPFMPPMTNADKIRAMSDEELAEFISRIEIGDFGPQVYGKTFCDMCKGQYECDDCRLWWLEHPAEEDT